VVRQEAPEERLQLVIFRLDETEFGVPIDQVRRLERLKVVTRVPRAPHFLEGVVNIRGDVVPVVNLKKRFGLATTPCDDKSRIVVVALEDQLVGLMVDAVREVLWFPASQIDPPPSMVARIDGAYLTGVGRLADRRIILLNLERVLATPEVEELAARHRPP